MPAAQALPSGGKTIVSHHSLRGIAALLVVVYHVDDIFPRFAGAAKSATAFFSHGYLWVDFFFILSGFIISHVYAQRLVAGGRLDRAAVRPFMVSRFARLYPLHLFTLLALVAIELSARWLLPHRPPPRLIEHDDLPAFFENLTLTQGWGLAKATWNPPAWSISTEVLCYAAFPVLVLALNTKSALSLGPAALGIAVALYAGIFSRFDSVEQVAGAVRGFAGFLAGVFIFSMSDRIRRWPRSVTAAAQALGLLGIAVSMHYGHWQYLTVLSFALLIAATSNDTGPLAPLLRLPLLAWLGTLSFSIYLDHYVLIKAYWIWGDSAFSTLAGRYSPITVAWLKFGLLAGALLAMSAITYAWVESPARKRLARRLASPAGRAPATLA